MLTKFMYTVPDSLISDEDYGPHSNDGLAPPHYIMGSVPATNCSMLAAFPLPRRE